MEPKRASTRSPDTPNYPPHDGQPRMGQCEEGSREIRWSERECNYIRFACRYFLEELYTCNHNIRFVYRCTWYTQSAMCNQVRFAYEFMRFYTMDVLLHHIEPGDCLGRIKRCGGVYSVTCFVSNSRIFSHLLLVVWDELCHRPSTILRSAYTTIQGGL